MDYFLAGKSGTAKGHVWPLRRKLVLGRDQACDVFLPDGLVSRRHCTLTVEHGRVHLEDLGSSNATLVNGRLAKRMQLDLGDEIGVGSSLLVLCSVPAGAAQYSDEPDASTNRVRLSDITALPQASDAPSGTPKTIDDLAEVFNVGRELSLANSVEGLVTILLQRLSERFAHTAVFVIRLESDGRRALIFPAHASAQLDQPELFQAARAVYRDHQVHLMPPDNKKRRAARILAPIAVAGETQGVFMLECQPPRTSLGEHEIELLLALANAAAPYFTVVQRMERLERENERLIAGARTFGPIIGNSPAVQQVRTLARNCARSNLSVLITGETGTGKELVARMVHELSHLADHPLVIVNCAALPAELFESELFGHERGAFTGALARKAGLLEECNGGTLFLDEIGDLSLPNQARLLRALETGTFRRVGGSADIQVEFRLISATNMPLHQHIMSGKFRSDFFHRLAGIELHLPPLRERRADIPELAQYFLEQSRLRHRHQAEELSLDALQALERRDWPGNIRELRNVVERACVMAQRPLIEVADLLFNPDNHAMTPKFLTLPELERQHIQEALRLCNGNVHEAAQMLGIGRSTLYRKLEDFQEVPQ